MAAKIANPKNRISRGGDMNIQVFLSGSALNGLVRVDFGKARSHGPGFLAVAGLLFSSFPASAQALPANADTTCIVTPSQFAGWFQKNSVTPNGIVNPANSLTFIPNSNCSFYQWSEQMFLWLNSPAPVSYGGGGGTIFNSPTFFDVSPTNSSGQRTLISHVAGVIRPFPVPLRTKQVGPDGLQVIFDTAGRMLEVAPAKTSTAGKPLILNAAGRQVEIGSATVANGKAVFLDTAGRPIAGAKPILAKPLMDKALLAVQPRAVVPVGKFPLPAKTAPMLIVQKFSIGANIIFIDPFGNPDPVEQGQAEDDSVLETQAGSLVYYTIFVNDVYAYFLTGAKTGGITPAPTLFPTATADLTKIVNFALTKGKTFPDPNALAIEVKASWVDASTLSNPGTYITMNATVPVYSPACPPFPVNPAVTMCTASGSTQTKLLALVGMHVVGSVQGHPEMIWSTFEHVGNTPLGAYTYSVGGAPTPVPQSTAGSWLFSAPGSTGPFNDPHMATAGANIKAASGFSISPSDTLRVKAFGAATDLLPLNTTVPSATEANTDIISINNSVRGMLMNPDVRANYLLSGATWTFGGAAPTFNSAMPPMNNSNQVGTSFLTNSTLETYQQGLDSTSLKGSTNCFTCHNGGTSLAPTVPDGLSHIFSDLQPLP
jgi:hypothetical protein